jgi:hypothetical protein
MKRKIKSIVNNIESVDIVLGTAMCLYLTFLIINLSKIF